MAHLDCDIESRRDYTALIYSTNEFDNNLARSVIINDFKFTNIS